MINHRRTELLTMMSLLNRLRTHFDAGYARQALDDRTQVFTDPALRKRLMDAVDAAIDNADPDELDLDTYDEIEHACIWWRWRRRDVSAQRTTHPHRRDHAIYVEGLRSWSDPNAGPYLVTLDGEQVRFAAGCGFDTPTAFLDWFEAA